MQPGAGKGAGLADHITRGDVLAKSLRKGRIQSGEGLGRGRPICAKGTHISIYQGKLEEMASAANCMPFGVARA